MGFSRALAIGILSLAILIPATVARSDDTTPPGVTRLSAPAAAPVPPPAAVQAAAPAPASKPPGAAGSVADGDDPAAAVTADLQAQAAAYQKISANPMAALTGGAPTAAGTAPNGIPSAGGEPQAGAGAPAEMLKLMQSPQIQAYLKAFQSPEAGRALASAGEVMNHPNRKTLLYAEGVWLVLFFILRAWRNSKAETFVAKMWVSAWTAVVGVAVSSVILPYALIGPQYLDIAMQLFEVARQARG